MLEGTCGICFNTYDEQKFVPKVLDCGHSFCNVCIASMNKKPDSSCPYCRKKLRKVAIVDYPTNYSLLTLAENSKIPAPREQLKQEIALLKLKLARQKDVISKTINENNAYLKFLKEGLSDLHELENFKMNDISLADSYKLIRQLERETEKPKGNVWCHRKSFKSVAIEVHLNDFSSPKSYLLEVFRRICLGERFFAVNNHKDQTFYGEVSVWENMIFLHALAMPELPVDAKLIWFQDLNACLTGDKIQVFMKMSRKNIGLEKLVVIQLEKTPLTHQFIKLCSGESGALYKGAPYRKIDHNNGKFCSIFEVSHYISNGVPKTGRIDYASDSNVRVRCNDGDVVVFAWEDGSFVFSKCIQDGRGIDIIGKVTSTSLEEFVSGGSSQFMKITDSGIIYNLSD